MTTEHPQSTARSLGRWALAADRLIGPMAGNIMGIVGMPRMEAMVTLPAFSLFYEEKRILGSKYGSAQVRRDFQRFLDLIQTGRLDTTHMVSRKIKLDEVNDAFRAMEAGEVIRSVITH